MNRIFPMDRGTMNEAARCSNTPRPLTHSTSNAPKEGLAMKPTLKLCPTCDELRPADNFYVYESDGKQYTATRCKRCDIAASVKSATTFIERRGGYRPPSERLTPGGMTGKERAAHWATYKRNHGCADCGTRDHRVLQFDHLPQFEKAFTISDSLGRTGAYSDEQIATEVAKCDVVCAKCHRLRTTSRMRYPRDYEEPITLATRQGVAK